MKLKQLIHSVRQGAAVLGGVGLALLAFSTASADEVTPDLNQAEANRLSIFHDYGISSIGSTAGQLPDTTDGGLMSSYFGRWVTDSPTPSDRPWSLAATPIIGYDSDPEGLSKERGSLFGGAELAANYALDVTQENGDPTHLAAGYDITGAVYKGTVKQGDNLQQTAFAAANHKMFGDTFVVSGAFRDQFTMDHGTAFLNAIDAGAGGEVFWLSQLSTELSYRYSHLDYFFPVVKTQDPDAGRHTLSLDLHLFPKSQTREPDSESPDRLTDFLRSSLGRFTIGYGYVWNRADGQNYDYEANRLVVGLDDLRPFHTNNLSFDMRYAHEWQIYLNKNNETTPTLNGNHFLLRHDHLDIFTLRANARLADLAKNRGTIGTFLQWDIIADRSNIQNRDFNEFIISTGLVYQY